MGHIAEILTVTFLLSSAIMNLRSLKLRNWQDLLELPSKLIHVNFIPFHNMSQTFFTHKIQPGSIIIPINKLNCVLSCCTSYFNLDIYMAKGILHYLYEWILCLMYCLNVIKLYSNLISIDYSFRKWWYLESVWVESVLTCQDMSRIDSYNFSYTLVGLQKK
jgi:hypothetical protein